MTTRSIARIYNNADDAHGVVQDLEAAGIPEADISLIRHNEGEGSHPDGAAAGASGTGVGASVGTLVGGGAGLLAGLGSLAIPGIGPVVAAGWLIATLTGAGVGAAAGGLLGALTGVGIDRDEAAVYDEGVKRGGTLVTARVEESRATEAEAIMGRRNPADWRSQGEDYRTGGWQAEAEPGAHTASGLTADGSAADLTRRS